MKFIQIQNCCHRLKCVLLIQQGLHNKITFSCNKAIWVHLKRNWVWSKISTRTVWVLHRLPFSEAMRGSKQSLGAFMMVYYFPFFFFFLQNCSSVPSSTKFITFYLPHYWDWNVNCPKKKKKPKEKQCCLPMYENKSHR